MGALRETLDLLLRSFPVRTCSDTKFKRHERLGRPCLLYDIERCSGPCVGAVEPDRYRGMVEDLMRFLSGDTAAVVARLEAEMAEASEALEFERAARLRDQLTAVRKAAETQQMVSERPEDLDVVGIAEDELEAAVQVFHVRRGRVVGRSGSIADKVEDLSPAQLVERVVEQLYGAPGAEVPRRVLVPVEPEATGVLEAWLAGLRGRAGRRCRCPGAATSGRCRRWWSATPPRTWPGTGCDGPPTTTAAPGPSPSCRAPSGWPRPRCGSSATT